MYVLGKGEGGKERGKGEREGGGSGGDGVEGGYPERKETEEGREMCIHSGES